ncbi:MAG: hypothetical protein E4G99_12295 [Anaerolineales bacterium]|nr:MAG: hypothetical protein E4G99_12295 [Anaerolineales bacterium]
MAHYLIVHNVESYPSSQDEWIDTMRRLRLRACGEVTWLHSFFEPGTGKLYCQWQAPDLDSVIACLTEETLALAPIASTSEVVLVDAAWLDEVE